MRTKVNYDKFDFPTYIYDLETIVDEWGKLKCFAAGVSRLGDICRENVKIYYGYDAIYEMISQIDNSTE